jgi:hypothetical protein
MSKQHTALPWVCGDNGLVYGQCSPDDEEAPFVADIIADRERAIFGIMSDIERANLALIIQACNRHAELVAMLRQVQMFCAAPRLTRIRKQHLVTAIATLLRMIDDEVQP